MKSLRRFLSVTLLLVTCNLALGAKRPNIVFIFSDDHATNAISAYGSRLAESAPTPNLDRIANEGALFKNSFCANSICGPSRANILTGKHSHINGFLNNNRARFDGSQTTFPKILQKSGYDTAMIGKWHLVTDPTGFNYWEILPGQGAYYNPDLIQMEGGRKRYNGYVTDIITDRAIDWLDNGRDKEKPFVLMCQHKAPHRNWSPAQRHLTLFDDIDFPEPDNLFDDYKGGRSKTLAENAMSIRHHFYSGHDMKFHGEPEFPDHFLKGIKNAQYNRMTPEQKAAWDKAYEPKNQKLLKAIRSGKLNEKEITQWKYQRYMRDYLRCIRAVDENVGRVLDYLDKNDLAENTVVIYSSDQGFYLGEHGWYDKRWMFEESLEMPFLVRWPGVVKPGTRPEALIQNIDYAPTFLDITGTPIPASAKFQGRSILPALKDTSKVPDGWRDAIYYTYYGENTHNVAPHDGVRTAAHKLMYFPATKEWNLIDLVKDPDEMRSFHDDPRLRLRPRRHDRSLPRPAQALRRQLRHHPRRPLQARLVVQATQRKNQPRQKRRLRPRLHRRLHHPRLRARRRRWPRRLGQILRSQKRHQPRLRRRPDPARPLPPPTRRVAERPPQSRCPHDRHQQHRPHPTGPRRNRPGHPPDPRPHRRPLPRNQDPPPRSLPPRRHPPKTSSAKSTSPSTTASPNSTTATKSTSSTSPTSS